MHQLIQFIDEFKHGPEWATMAATVENSQWHREANVAVHTQMVMDYYVRNFAEQRNDQQNKIALLALLYHDTGKPISEVPKTDGSGANSYPGHEPKSGVLFSEAYVRSSTLRELLTVEEARAVRWIIEHHLPYGYTHRTKRAALKTATMNTVWMQTFYDCLRSDGAGRISDNHETKLQAVEDWIRGFTANECAPETTAHVGNIMFLLCGAPGAGKSTWMAQHKTDQDVVISLDRFRLEFLEAEHQLTTYENEAQHYEHAWKFASEHKNFYKFVDARIAELLKDHTGSVFVDNTNASKKSRAQYVALAKLRNMNCVGVEFWNTAETLLARQFTRGDKNVPEQAVMVLHHAQASCWLGDEVHAVQVVIGE